MGHSKILGLTFQDFSRKDEQTHVFQVLHIKLPINCIAAGMLIHMYCVQSSMHNSQFRVHNSRPTWAHTTWSRTTRSPDGRKTRQLRNLGVPVRKKHDIRKKRDIRKIQGYRRLQETQENMIFEKFGGYPDIRKNHDIYRKQVIRNFRPHIPRFFQKR